MKKVQEDSESLRKQKKIKSARYLFGHCHRNLNPGSGLIELFW
ncbi:hypothetical protein OENI_590005 [Oenococcus oeni]|nr:hypothetical protein [Oenococcus oeni]SYW09109.1 hypothetical protein OENI_590005 [Oenococcus oeni]